MSKYNNKKVEVDGHVFDSEVEAMYYNLLKERHINGEVESFEIQPKFILQPKFRKRGKLFHPITYSADFKVVHNNGRTEIIDIKGMETDIFKLKAKIFEYTFPDLELVLLKYSKLDGGFVTPQVYKEGVAKRKIERAKKKAEKERLKKEKLDKKNQKG